MQQYEQVYQALKEMGIEYEVVEHPPAFTTEEADRYIDGKVGVCSKTLFLVNRNRSTFFLVIMDDSKRLDFKKLANLLSEKRVSFASSEQLMEKLQLSPGVVSLFGLLNNSAKDIQVYLDKDMLQEKIVTFHANDNSKTIFISMEDMYRFILGLGYTYKVIDL